MSSKNDNACKEYRSLARATNRKDNLRSQSGSLSEFAPALILLMVLFSLPLAVIVRIGSTTIGMQFALSEAVDASAKAPTYGAAEDSAHRTLTAIAASPIARLAGLQADVADCVSLYITEQVPATGAITVVGPDRVLPYVAKTDVAIYQYELRSSLTFSPLIKCPMMPCLAKVPFLTAPVAIKASSSQAAEYPQGMSVN